ncbi:alpha/beta hydrolase fold domain-containing protein [Enterococcus faecium]|uniref:alpha/beta hydrolase fold domain-containing protein n=1 Tax=Enterococcus faecium TaxID=1352 RepID=UPI0015CCDFEC|nr:alpha/beta hydrolase [Enterococcus faecium]NTQ82956.1 alpha/beta hydrolase [Enterococcus faecium]HAQ0425780.1 alpha/beta hydrolase [Enterococcus faecium]
MKRKIIPAIAASAVTLYGYSHLIEKRSFSSFSIEKLFKLNRFLGKNSSVEDKIYDALNKSAEQMRFPMQPPKKYVSNDVYDFYSNDMQVFCWNDKKSASQKVIFYIHGGGYVSAPLSFHYKMVENISRKTDAKVIFPIYDRLPFANYKDVYPKMINLYTEILKTVNSAQQVTIMGDSAGGGLALGLALLCKEKEISQPKNIVLLSPWLDISNSNPKLQNIINLDPTLDVSQLNYFGRKWSDNDLNNHLVSPKNGNPEDLGNLTIFTGLHEIFYPDVLEYHEKLQKLNIKHNLIVEPRMNHVYVAYPIPEAKKAQKMIATIIKDS